jgi:hypothetical protein
MPGTLNVGGHDIITHSGTAGAGTINLVDQAGNTILTDSGSGMSISSNVAFPAGHVIQTKIIKESSAYGPFSTQGDNYTGIDISFDNNLASTNSTVLIESSIQYDIVNDAGIGFTWASSSSTLTGNKIGVDGSNITNFSIGSTPYHSLLRHGDTISFFAHDTNITSTTPKTYYLWLINATTEGAYINYHANVAFAAQLGTGSYWSGSATSVFKLTEIAG